MLGNHIAEETIRYQNSSSRLQERYDNLLELSPQVYSDGFAEILAIRNEKVMTAKEVAAAAIAAAKAKFLACSLAAAALPTPANLKAEAACLGWHALALTGILTTLDWAIDNADNDLEREDRILQLEQNQRDTEILARKKRDQQKTRIRIITPFLPSFNRTTKSAWIE